jgi:hypothetical protein
MLTTLAVAIGGAIVVLALSWIVSTIGFMALVKTKGQAVAVAYTKVVGNLTGMVLVLGVLVTVVKLIADLVGW